MQRLPALTTSASEKRGDHTIDAESRCPVYGEAFRLHRPYL